MTGSLTKKNHKFYVLLRYKVDSKWKMKWVNTDIPDEERFRKKAEKRRIEIIQEYSHLEKIKGGNMLFSDYLRQWLEDTKHTIAESTYQSYKSTVCNCICPYFEEKKIKLVDLKTRHIQEFYLYKMNEDCVSANTIHHYNANISKALNYAVLTELIKDNPAKRVQLPKIEMHTANVYTADELKILIDNAMGTPLETVVLLASWFGMRRGEIIGLKWSCIDFDRKTLSVIGVIKDKGKSGSKVKNLTYKPFPKTKASLRSFPLSDNMIEYLKSVKERQEQRKRVLRKYNHEWDEFVCVRDNGDLLPLEYVSRTFPKLCEKCGLRRLKLHELRHTNITLLVQNGANMKDVQGWAGHTNYKTTANIYAHTLVDDKVKLLKRIDDILE